MTVSAIDRPSAPSDGIGPGEFRHEALFYRGEDEFLDATAAFVAEGVAAGEPVLVVVSAARIEKLRTRLGWAADGVEFADMATVGPNPARIIPAWQDFVRRCAGGGRPMRGIGEPINTERSPAALTEYHCHEALLNLAFAGSGTWTLLCPYDTEALAPEVIEEARRNHPICVEGGHGGESSQYQGLDRIRPPFEAPLPEPAGRVVETPFDDESSLWLIRKAVLAFASGADMEAGRADDLVVAVNEVVTNSLRHGGGHGLLRMWRDGDSVLCEVSDGGLIEDALAGRSRPNYTGFSGGRGLWMVNQLSNRRQRSRATNAPRAMSANAPTRLARRCCRLHAT